MYVVINIDPGSTLNELMAFMTQRTITFSVTDRLARLVKANGDHRDFSTQTDDSSEPLIKKTRIAYNREDYGSPCSSATPSEHTDSPIIATPSKKRASSPNQMGYSSSSCSDAIESSVLRKLIKNKIDQSEKSRPFSIKEETEDASVEDEMDNTDSMQNKLMQALFPNGQNSALNDFVGLEDADSLEGESRSMDDLPISFLLDNSPGSAIRYKPTYASTKRGVCHVCNREVSLITTHRRRHAITHLGFKTLKCVLCHKFFSRQDLATGHFKKDHPTEEFSPFVDTMSEDDERQLCMMLELCFPEENVLKKRRKDGEPKKLND